MYWFLFCLVEGMSGKGALYASRAQFDWAQSDWSYTKYKTALY